MTRRFAAIALSTALLLTSLALPASTTAQTVRSMAATGDSITRAFNLCFFPFTDCPTQSWSTGTNTTVNSHARRLGITSTSYNDSVSGAKMANLTTQINTVFTRNVDYVTVLMGGNDVCTDTEGQMTSASAYEVAFRQAMDKLNTDSTPPLVYVVSVPDVRVLWQILKDNSTARSRWSTYNVCQSLLANPLSTAQVDVDRRERVKQRNMDFNQALRSACAAYSFCRFDGERAFGTPFVPNDVSTRDYFHPSTAGQKKLADVSWTYGPLMTSAVNAPPAATFTASCSGLTCTFTDTSTDPNGIGGRSWQFGDGRTSTSASAAHTFAAGGTYAVTLYSIDSLGATSKTTVSVIVSSGGADTTPPTAPTGLTAVGGDGSVALDWAPNTETDLAGYRVHRSEAAGGPYTTVSGSSLVTGSAYQDGTVSNGMTYYYVVTAEDVAGNVSALSTEAQATPQGAGGETPTMHVADLDGVRAVRGNNWTVSVTIEVVDASGTTVAGAAASGDWGAGGTSSCTTSTDGRCSVSISLNSKKVTSTTFTITGVILSGYAYDASSNADSEGDSDGTSITVALN